MSDEWGFSILCQRCGSQATVENRPWNGLKDVNGVNVPNVEVSCSNPDCDQPSEWGGVSWWKSSSVPALLFSDTPMFMGDSSSSIGTNVVITYLADGTRHDSHCGSTARGRSNIVESLGVPLSTVPLNHIMYRFVDDVESIEKR